MEYKTITDADVRKFANIRITNAQTDISVPNNINHANLGVYDVTTINNTPKYDDPKNDMGKTPSLQMRCITCGETSTQCYGGYGYVDISVSYTHLRAHETPEHLVCRLLLEKKKS